ncbi:DsbA family protein [Patescibacteria group bacterium]
MEEQTNQAPQGQTNPSEGGSLKKILVIVGILIVIIIIAVMIFSKGDEVVEPKVEGVAVENTAEEVVPEEILPDEVAAPPQINLSSLAVTSADNVKGDENAPLTIVLYDDFECPFCGAFEGTNQEVMDMLQQRSPGWEAVMPNLTKDYIDTGKVKLVYRHFPLSFHQNALPAAEATECAGAQDKFWEMHDAIFAVNGEELSLEKFAQMAEDLDLDMDKYNSCMDNHETVGKIQADMQSAQAVGVNGTPGVYIGDQLVSGAVPYSDFKQIVDEKLK